MSALQFLVSRSRCPAPAPPVWSSSGPRRRVAGLCRRTRLLFGLLLVATGLPAFGFDGAPRAPRTAQDLLLHSSGVPASADWVVLDATGTTAWRAQGETRWHRFTRGQVLPPGCENETGSDGEIMLVAGGDQLTIAPRSRLLVPFAQPGQDRRLRHERGRILVQIETRAARDVRVDTPLLTLGIKGATFEVALDPQQDSVVVHQGEVEVTIPGQPDPVDLGAGDGLRQSADPGASATRFTLPGPGARAGAAGEPLWRLPPARLIVRTGPQSVAPVVPSDSVAARIQSDGTRGYASGATAPLSRGETHAGWLDGLASSGVYMAIAGVALLALTVPGLALLQQLRQQWQNRPRTKGRRRHELVRG